MAKRDDSPIFFSAFLNANSTPASNTPFLNWTISANVGGGVFAGADGSYTAPKTGWYRVHASMFKLNVASAGGFTFRINGVNQNRIGYSQSVAAEYDMATGEDFYYITAGQKVQVINSDGIAWYGQPPPNSVGRWIVEFKPASAT